MSKITIDDIGNNLYYIYRPSKYFYEIKIGHLTSIFHNDIVDRVQCYFDYGSDYQGSLEYDLSYVHESLDEAKNHCIELLDADYYERKQEILNVKEGDYKEWIKNQENS